MLVVDDDAVTRRVTTDVFTRMGWAVYACEDAEAARGAFARNRPFELAVVDVLLPGMRGTAFAAELARADAALPVILVSSRVTLAPDGHARFLAKPFSAQALLNVVEELTGPR